jgi:putative spermidine/putrescine transport system permease protein
MKKNKMKTWNKKPVILYMISAFVLLFLVLPILIVVPMSFNGASILQFPPTSFSLRWYQEFFNSQQWTRAAFVSVKIALGTTVLSCALGILSALGLSKKVLRNAKALKLLLMAPMMLPSIIVAISMYLVYGQWRIVGSYFAIIVAHTCLAIPFVVTLISASMTSLDPRQYDAARSLGANHFTAVRKVVLPLIKPAIFSSMLFSFITSFDETVLVLFITKTNTLTLPRVIYADLRYGISPSLAAVSSLLIFITLFLFFLSRVLAGMRPEAKAARLAAKMEKQEARGRSRLEDGLNG